MTKMKASMLLAFNKMPPPKDKGEGKGFWRNLLGVR